MLDSPSRWAYKYVNFQNRQEPQAPERESAIGCGRRLDMLTTQASLIFERKINMRKVLLIVSMLVMASFLTACDPAANSNLANKPANAANTNTVAAKTAEEITAIETEIKRLVSDAAASMTKNDVAAFEKMTTDNYLFINPDGRIST